MHQIVCLADVRHAAETDVGGRTVLGLRRAGRGPVAVAVLRRAEVRAALQRLVDAGVRVPGRGATSAGFGVDPVAGGISAWSSTPTRCRSCRPGPNGVRAGTLLRATCPPSRVRPVVAMGEEALPGVGHQSRRRARPRRPRRRPWTCHRGRRTPTRLRWVADGPAQRRVGSRRRRRQICTTGWSSRSLDPAARAERSDRQLAPGAQSHHCRQSRRSTGPDVGRNTSAPGSRSAVATPGYSAGSSGRSATVT